VSLFEVKSSMTAISMKI